MNHRILLIDDDQDTLEFVSGRLSKEGYKIYTEKSGAEGIKTALKILPHLIVLDITMPGMDGLEACRELRKHDILDSTMIVFLTVHKEDSYQLSAYNAGGDNYLTKPVNYDILASHVNAMLKRVDPNDIPTPNKNIRIDRSRHLVIKDDAELILPRKEFNLLTLLYSRPQRVFTREEIYDAVWGSDVVVGDRTIDVHIRKLREKIGSQHIVTIKGVGYKYLD